MTHQQTDSTHSAHQPNGSATTALQPLDIALLSPEGYKKRYGDALEATGDKVKAWERIEAELQAQFKLRRFLTYQSFEVTFSMSKNRKIKNPDRLKFHYVG